MSVVCLMLAWATVAQAPSGAPESPVQSSALPKLGVFSIDTASMGADLQGSAISAIAAAAAKTGLYQVVSRSELDAMLGAEKLKDATGCDSVSCLAEIGAATGVERVVGGTVSKVESAVLISLQLVTRSCEPMCSCACASMASDGSASRIRVDGKSGNARSTKRPVPQPVSSHAAGAG